MFEEQVDITTNFYIGREETVNYWSQGARDTRVIFQIHVLLLLKLKMILLA